MNFTFLNSLEKVPKDVGVIISDSVSDSDSDSESYEGQRPHKPTVFLNSGMNIERKIDEAIELLFPKAYSRVVIGIDPGIRPGLAVFIDDSLVEAKQVPVDRIYREVKIAIGNYISDRYLVRIGDGARRFRDQIIRSISPLNVEIEIIDEKGTSKNASDIVAAERIAKIGTKIKVIERDLTIGEIKSVQQASRVKSQGEFTISRELAVKVINGDLTMMEALEKHKER